MLSLFVALIWPLAALGATCADSPPVAGMVCYDLTRSDGQPTTVFANNELQYDAPPTTPTGLAPRVTLSAIYTGGISRNLCQDSTFELNPDPFWAPVTDCASIAEWAAGHTVYWRAYKSDLMSALTTTILISGKCTFVISYDVVNPPEYGMAIGSTDVADLAADSINKHSQDGLWVSTMGVMQCQTTDSNGGGFATALTKWGMFRSDRVPGN